MDASKSNEVNAIIPLSIEEIELVSGGKSVVPSNYMERFSNWLSGSGAFPCDLPLSNILSAMESATRDAGGTFARNAAGLISIMRSDGEVATIET